MFSEPIRQSSQWISIDNETNFKLIAESLKKSTSGTQATLTLLKGEETIANERVHLDTDIKRKKFIYRCKEVDPKDLDRIIVAIRRAYEATHSQTAYAELYMANHPNIVDIVKYEDKIGFCLLENGTLRFAIKFKCDEIEKLPPPDLPWLPGRYTEIQKHFVNDSDISLFNDLLAYFRDIAELPSEECYTYIVLFVFLTYLVDKFEYAPILSMFAIHERGKSRLGKGIIYVSFRGVHVISLREAFILRLAHDYKASIFFDIMDVWNKAEKNGTEDILLGRFEKGCRSPRVNNPDRGSYADTVFYETYGPTILATNRPLFTILESRGIQLQMPQSTRAFNSDVKEIHGQHYRERLLAFRARNLAYAPPEIEKPCAGRLGDILRPIFQIAHGVNPAAIDSIKTLIKQWEQERSLEQMETLEGIVLLTLKNIVNDNGILNGMVPIKDLTDKLNEGKTDGRKISYQRIGKIIRSLGFQKGRIDNNSALVWDDAKFKTLADRYGIELEPIPPEQIHETHDSEDVTTEEGFNFEEPTE